MAAGCHFRQKREPIVKLAHLFEPIKLGSLALPNRIMFPAVTTYYDTHYDLKGDERSAFFYAERARGGAGLLVVGALQALYPGRRDPPRIAINNDRFIPQLRLWTKTIHQSGAMAAAQLAVWNYWASDGEGTPAEDISPSGVVTTDGNYPHGFKKVMFEPKSRPLTVEEILLIEEQVAMAAERAVEGGFDAIELPAVALNLFSRFITPYTNRRTDEYGGDWIKNTRFLVETIALIKKRLPLDFPIIVRIPGTDMMPWGIDLEDSRRIAPIIAAAGIHCLSIMPGGYETREPRQQMSVPRDAFIYLAEGIRQVVDVPVCANMRINDPVLADRILAEGKADMVAMCRPLVADPELPDKACRGKINEVRFCVACCACFDDIAVSNSMGCSVNAQVGREKELAITKTKKPRRVLVIGGGPAGMEAARVAAHRGNHVTLLEKSNRLGGQLFVASVPPYKQEWASFTSFLSNEMRRLKVDVRLNFSASVNSILRMKSEAVIVATGAVPIIPSLPGINLPNVSMAIDILEGSNVAGDKVVIVGGGLVGCETAEFILQLGKKVTILEMLPRIGDDIGMFNRWVVLDRLAAAGVGMETDVRVIEIAPDHVRGLRGGTELCFHCDSVVIAVGMKADNTLGRELEGKVPWLKMVGACVEPRRVKQAVAEGFQAGFEV